MKRTTARRIALIGDSIRIGYEPFVRAELKGHRFVSPKENSGDSLALLENFEPWFRSCRADVIHVNGGLHDVRFRRKAQRHQGSPTEYEANLGELVERLRELKDVKVVWALTTPVIEERHNRTHPDFTRSTAEIQQYNAIARTIMTGAGIPIHDLYDVVMRTGPERLLSEDGVHFTEEGSRVLAQSVVAFLTPLLA